MITSVSFGRPRRWAVLIALIGALIGALILLAAPARAATTPELAVERLTASLIEVMREADALRFDGRRARLAPVLDEVFDFPSLTVASVGRTVWSDWPAEQRGRYAAVFRRYTLAAYAGQFDGFSGQRFEMLGSEAGPAGTRIVRTLLNSPDRDPVAIDYLLREGDEGWRIIDVFLEGAISELARQRAEFSAVLQRDGFEALIEALETKIADFAAGDPAPRPLP